MRPNHPLLDRLPGRAASRLPRNYRLPALYRVLDREPPEASGDVGMGATCGWRRSRPR